MSYQRRIASRYNNIRQYMSYEIHEAWACSGIVILSFFRGGESPLSDLPRTQSIQTPQKQASRHVRRKHLMIVSSLATFAAGYGLHVLKARREDRTAKDVRKEAAESARKDRIRHFKGFMSEFRSSVERSSRNDIGNGFHDKVNTFRGQTGRIRDDVPDHKQPRFDQAVTTLCQLTASQVTEYRMIEGAKGQTHVNDIGRDLLADAIDEVLAMLE
jgi:hypothetical protein